MFRRVLIAIAASAALLVVVALPAAAHVTIDPSSATKGGFTKLTFRVPTESATASTVKVEVQLPDPTSAPIASVSVEPIAGWSYKVDHTHLTKPISSDDGDVTDVVSMITWTADGDASAIRPGEFNEFSISAGPLPKNADQVEFKVLQTYSDGSVVRWIESSTGATEPDHPAPVLKLTDAAATGAASAGTSSAAAPSVSKSDVDGERTWGVVGVILGALALVAAAAAFVGSRRRRA